MSLSESGIKKQIIRDFCPAPCQDRRGHGQILHQKSRKRGRDRANEIAREIGDAAGEGPLLRRDLSAVGGLTGKTTADDSPLTTHLSPLTSVPVPEFEPLGAKYQVAAVGWAYGPALVDLDNDGWLDLYATAGFVSQNPKEPDG